MKEQQSSNHLATPVHPRLESFDEAVGQERAERRLEKGLVADVLAKAREPLLRGGSGHVEGRIEDQRALGRRVQ